MKIAIFGAGSIGCYLGGRLAASGVEVLFLGRERLRSMVRQHGLRLTHYANAEARVPAGDVVFETDPACLIEADIILVTVKSQDTRAAGATIAENSRKDAKIISIQNGVGNAQVLRAVLPDHAVAGGMVPFNVVNLGEGHFHCGTEGAVVVEQIGGLDTVVAAMNTAGVAAHQAADIDSVLWGKLVLNLNNALNMLSDRPLKEELAMRNYRLVLAEMIGEALDVMKVAGIRPARIGKAAPGLMPTILALPNWLFRIVASGMLKIDPKARSSMWEDLQAGRMPEIAYLNGAVVTLGKELGVETPVNARIVEAVEAAFEKGKSPGWDSDDVLRVLA